MRHYVPVRKIITPYEVINNQNISLDIKSLFTEEWIQSHGYKLFDKIPMADIIVFYKNTNSLILDSFAKNDFIREVRPKIRLRLSALSAKFFLHHLYHTLHAPVWNERERAEATKLYDKLDQFLKTTKQGDKT